METKEQLINTIKRWVKIDNEIRVLNKELSARKNEKKKISSELIEVMRKNEIDNFELKDGEIQYVKRNVKKPITQKALLGILSEYYKGDLLKASEMNNFIIENRVEVVKESIVRKINKVDESPEGLH
jgi:hypothetical protein